MSPDGESDEWMTNDGYGIASLGAVFDRDGPAVRGSARLTDILGCTHTEVMAHRVSREDPAGIGRDGERLCLPIGGSGGPETDPPLRFPDHGVARFPSGTGAELGGVDPVDWLVIGAPAEPTENGRPTVIDLEDLDYVEPSTSSIRTARLTEPLGCVEMKVNARLLGPGDRVPYHTEGRQEELFVPVIGDDTRMLIDGETVSLPVGSMARVAPRTPRAAINAGDDDSIWVMVGAPPTGGPDEWDPGAEVLPWPDGS